MKIITLVLCVLALLGSAASAYFYIQVGDTKKELQQKVSQAETRATETQTKLTEAAAQSDALQKRLAAMDGDLGDAKSKLTSADARNAQLARDLAQFRTQVTAKTDAEETLNREVGQLKRELAQIKLSASSATDPEEAERYKQTIATLQARVTELETRPAASAATTGVAGTAGAPAADGTPAAPGNVPPGEVLKVGNQSSFVVLNVGSKDGVLVDQKFTLTRGAETIATVQVSSVQNAFSVAQVVPSTLRSSPGKGDVATIAQ